jgi:hypothetical protein
MPDTADMHDGRLPFPGEPYPLFIALARDNFAGTPPRAHLDAEWPDAGADTSRIIIALPEQLLVLTQNFVVIWQDAILSAYLVV